MHLEKVVVGPLSVNCFIVACSKTKLAAVIDPGDEVDQIMYRLNKDDYTLEYILLTHGHVDHVAGVDALKRHTNAGVLMNREDLFLFDNLQTQAMMFGLPDPGHPEIDRFLNAGDTLTLGEKDITIMTTPGHSPGSVTYVIGENLFVGDLIFAGSIGRTDLPGGNYDTLIQSVTENIFTKPDEMIIHPGHGPSSTVGREKCTNPYF
ncbi:MAG: MBL fold metallo-hydrolase [candidate division KSB1 bacterium]|nr:MBL fold metallo-hydrolase [candidate division KSB1 bacterium]